MTAFPDSFGSRKNTLLTGNPLREEFMDITPPALRTHKTEEILRILVLGGSQGARVLNEVVPTAVNALAAHIEVQVRHQCGAAHAETARDIYAGSRVRAEVVPFMDHVAEELAYTDIVICRAGAMTVAEISAVGVAAIFVPFPHAVDDHQTRNAEYLFGAGAARVIPETELTAERLTREITELGNDPDLRLRMAEAVRAMGHPDATVSVVNECLRAIGRLKS